MMVRHGSFWRRTGWGDALGLPWRVLQDQAGQVVLPLLSSGLMRVLLIQPFKQLCLVYGFSWRKILLLALLGLALGGAMILALPIRVG